MNLSCWKCCVRNRTEITSLHCSVVRDRSGNAANDGVTDTDPAARIGAVPRPASARQADDPAPRTDLLGEELGSTDPGLGREQEGPPGVGGHGVRDAVDVVLDVLGEGLPVRGEVGLDGVAVGVLGPGAGDVDDGYSVGAEYVGAAVVVQGDGPAGGQVQVVGVVRRRVRAVDHGQHSHAGVGVLHGRGGVAVLVGDHARGDLDAVRGFVGTGRRHGHGVTTGGLHGDTVGGVLGDVDRSAVRVRGGQRRVGVGGDAGGRAVGQHASVGECLGDLGRREVTVVVGEGRNDGDTCGAQSEGGDRSHQSFTDPEHDEASLRELSVQYSEC